MKELACIPTLKRRRDARRKPAILLNQLSHVWADLKELRNFVTDRQTDGQTDRQTKRFIVKHQSVDSEVSGYGWVEKRLQFSSGGRKFGVYVCQGS
uniref:Transposase n=1 Tax=Haemonchus contortus TaxID=6289 RepID=A0A7I5EAK3_HAECO